MTVFFTWCLTQVFLKVADESAGDGVDQDEKSRENLETYIEGELMGNM